MKALGDLMKTVLALIGVFFLIEVYFNPDKMSCFFPPEERTTTFEPVDSNRFELKPLEFKRLPKPE